MMVMARVGRVKVAASLAVVRDMRLILTTFSVAMLLFVLTHPILIPAEAALHLQCGILIAKGQVPYKDFFELAAPALQYFNAVPALFARIIPFHPAFVCRLFTWALYTISSAATAYILLNARSRDQRLLPWFVIGYSALPFFFLAQFGQAEQVFVFLFMPYFLLRWLRWSGANGSVESSENSADSSENNAENSENSSSEAADKASNLAVVPLTGRQAIVCGAAGGFAAALDPLFLIAFLAMEVYFFLDKQRKGPLLAPEFRGALAVIALSIVVAFLFGEDYVGFALPIVFFDYKHWDDRLIYVYKTPDRRDLIYLMVALVTLSLAFKKRCSLIPPLVAFSIVGFGVWIIPGEAFTHQSFLMLYGCVTAGALALGSLLNQVALFLDRWIPLLAHVSKAVLVVCVVGFLWATYQSVESLDKQSFIDFTQLNYLVGISPRKDLSDLSELIEVKTWPEDKVLILSDKDRPAYPLLVQMNRQPGSYLLTGTPMRVIRRILEREPVSCHEYFVKLKDRMYSRLANDIRMNKPKLILVDFDSIGDLLEINRVMVAVGELYATEGTVNMMTYEKLHPSKEYLGFQNPFQLYYLKGLKLPPLLRAPGEDPEVNALPRPPVGTPGLPLQNPAPGPLAPGVDVQTPPPQVPPRQTPAPGPLAPGKIEQKPEDNVIPPAKQDREQAPSPVANPIRI